MHELDPETVVYPEFEHCVVGFVERIGQPPVIAYDRALVLDVLRADLGDDAEEYFDYNVLGAYVGPFTPCFITFDRTLVAGRDGTGLEPAGTGADSGAISDGDATGDSE